MLLSNIPHNESSYTGAVCIRYEIIDCNETTGCKNLLTHGMSWPGWLAGQDLERDLQWPGQTKAAAVPLVQYGTPTVSVRSPLSEDIAQGFASITSSSTLIIEFTHETPSIFCLLSMSELCYKHEERCGS
jgi:hypothetical protein